MSNAGRSADGRNVPVSVDCAPFRYALTTADWNTALEQTFTVRDGPSEDTDGQQTGYMATGRADREPSPQSGREDQGQGQGRVPGHSRPQAQNPDGSSTENDVDDTGDVSYLTVSVA